MLSGWNVAVVITAAFSVLGALVVVLARERTAKPEANTSGPEGA